ncbi:MAG: hypothetical protein WD072_00725 [Pirellulales bacterium]
MVTACAAFPAWRFSRPHGGPAPSRRYERRRPEKTPLHKVVSENLESWLEWRDRSERPVPGYVEEEFRGYLECGILCFGLARALHDVRHRIRRGVLVQESRRLPFLQRSPYGSCSVTARSEGFRRALKLASSAESVGERGLR